MNTLGTHESVMTNEAIRALGINPSGVYVDATFGRGGHSKAILNELNKDGRLIAFDRDQDAVDYGNEIFADDKRFTIYHASFSKMKEILLPEGMVGKVSGILMDLGLSSVQLDATDRGFSFQHDSFLDMRMNQQEGITASQWLNSASEKEIDHVLRFYGEERFSHRIAREIVTRRKDTPITTTGQLVAICQKVVYMKKKKKHPATRAFLAIRIWINQEFEELNLALNQTLDVLTEGGRLVVISFHSLEDRIVKRFIKKFSESNLPPKLPILVPEIFRLKKRGKVKPSLDEVKINRRARSAILRVAEKLS